MAKPEKYVFVDLNHLAHRSAYVHQDLTHGSLPVGMMYGVFKSLMKFKRTFPVSHIVLAWDAGHDRRDKESLEGVSQGIVPEAYKENRLKTRGDEKDLVKWQMEQQWDLLHEGLSYTSCQQVQKKGYEADDVICSYVLGCQNSSVIITSDKDYYQLLEPGVSIHDPVHGKEMNLDAFQEEFGLTAPQQWVDVGALSGDTSDNIFGVPGIGEKTAIKLIVEHKSLNNLFKYLHEQKSSGITLPKRQQAILDHEERVKLAFSLKEMDENIPNLPPLKYCAGDPEKLLRFFERFEFESLYTAVRKLT